MLEKSNELNIEQFSKAICSARKKVIVANRSSFSVGHFLYFELKKIIPDVMFLSDYDHGYYDIFEDLDENDVVIAICVPRYTSITVDFAQYAAEQAIKVISITDSRFSPLFSLSSICLFAVNTQSTTFHNSNVILMALADAIIAYVFDQNREIAIQRLEREEKILKNNRVVYYKKRIKN
jgi:DNA-binding MurR/RpiR family transcriptional regulator